MKANMCILEAEQRVIARQLGSPQPLESRGYINKQLAMVSSAIEKLAGQLLKYEQAGQKAAQTMNREQQIATIAKWFENLPPEDKRNLIRELTQIYNNKRSA
jgi:DNA-binding IclR family transcriptional regulator